MTMLRYPDWQKRLEAFVESRRRTPMKWGTHDCCMFACDAILAVTVAKIDFAEGIRGTYHSAVGARRVFKKLGVESVSQLLEKFTCPGFGPIPIPLAWRGDILVHESLYGPSAGVCYGPWGAFVGESGLEFVPRQVCLSAYHV